MGKRVNVCGSFHCFPLCASDFITRKNTYTTSVLLLQCRPPWASHTRPWTWKTRKGTHQKNVKTLMFSSINLFKTSVFPKIHLFNKYWKFDICVTTFNFFCNEWTHSWLDFIHLLTILTNKLQHFSPVGCLISGPDALIPAVWVFKQCFSKWKPPPEFLIY